MRKERDIPYVQEIARKSIHLTSLSIPIIYSFIDKELALWLLAPLAAFTLCVDAARYFFPGIRSLVASLFGKMMRQHELDENRFILSGATYVLLSAVGCVLFFPKVIAISAFSILIISDVASALIGRKFGTRRFLDKSFEGTMAFWVTAMAVIAWIGVINGAPTSFYLIGFFASLVGGVVEAASIRLKMDDNFSIPASIGLTMWLLLSAIDPAAYAEIVSMYVQ
jgi:dolichol kinase